MKFIKVKPGQIGYLHTSGSRTLSDTTFLCYEANNAVAVKQTGGSLVLRNVFIKGGHGPLIESGDYFGWFGGGSVGMSRKYGWGYYGNIHPKTNKRIRKVEFSKLNFPHGCKYEALLRVMGVDEMNIELCDAHSEYKQVCQFRHVKKLRVTACDLGWHMVLGVLRRKDCATEAEYQAYHKDAQLHRIDAQFDSKCILRGYGILTGQADLRFDGTLEGPFVRENCFSLETLPGIRPPTLDATRAKNMGWKKVR